MCGIVGFVDKRFALSPAMREEVLRAMLALIEHRGRDGVGVLADGSVAIGHTRLSILDPRTAANQPFASHSGNTVVAYNGEIYNYRQLNTELAREYPFRTNCDTETLVNGYEKWGERILPRLRGMFAFSILDRVRKRVMLAADRYAIKPLYIVDTPEYFAWASEAKAFSVLPGFQPAFNDSVLGEYLLFRQTAGAETMWREVKRLLPAHVLDYDIAHGTWDIRPYWTRPLDPFEERTTIERVGALLEDSVRAHLLSDVPVGLQLSGGVDSSLVAVLASRIKQEQFHTFSVGLSDAAWNEFQHSRRVAEMIGSEHHELVFAEADFCRELPYAIWHHDEPVNHPHSIPIMILSRTARSWVKVLLSGEGADELFGGYRRYLKFFSEPKLSDDALLHLSAFTSVAQWKDMLRFDIEAPITYRRRVLETARSLDSVDRMLALDQLTYLQSMLLRQDKMGMEGNIENRVPYLDIPLADASFALSPDQKVTKDETKRALKTVARSYLPSELVERVKCGFGLPIREWFRNPHGLGAYLPMLTSSQAWTRPFTDPDGLRGVIAAHKGGRLDAAEPLWILLNLELWGQIFMNGVGPDALRPES
jgi:asparagine synthase (glutamine-hydrolysing)